VPKVLPVVLAAAVLLPVAACGDDGALSKPDYVSQGNAICATGNEQFEALFANFPVTRETLGSFFARAAPIFRDTSEGLGDLEAPEGDEEQVRAFLDALERAVADFERAEEDPDLAVRLFGEEGGENLTTFEERSAAYGLTQCAEDEEEGEDEEELERLDPATFPADKQAFIAEADAVCTRGAARLRRLEETLFESFPPSLAQWAEALPQLVEVFRSTTEQVAELSPPEADRATITALLDRQRAAIDRLEEGVELAVSGDAQGFQDVVGPTFTELEEVDEELVRYGFQVCGPDEEGEE